MEVKHFDFGGWATKYNIRCADGRTIKPGAFKDQDKQQVSLVWQHGHDDVKNVLGHAILEHRPEGVYAYGTFNDTEKGRHAKELIKHGDINSLSIFANKLQEKGGDVFHGVIRELSLVLAGANPGAMIDNVALAHNADDVDLSEGIIYPGETSLDRELEHSAEDEKDELEHADDGVTMQQVYDGMSEDEKNVVHAMLAAVISADGDAEADDTTAEHSEKGDEDMKQNVFDKDGKEKSTQVVLSREQRRTLCHDVLNTAMSNKDNFKDALLQHAGDYGIDNIDYLFPEARTINQTPDYISRRMEWVSGVISGVRRSPFSRVKSIHADITADEARAKGYITGKQKLEEVFPLLKRDTYPQTIYKKQKLDRDDILDITDFDVVAWIRAEMRVMLEEEIARAILFGDGRDVGSDDKIDETKVRPIWTDDDLYTIKTRLDAGMTADQQIEAIVRARIAYKGSGNLTLYTTAGTVVNWLLMKDTIGRRLYPTMADLQAALGVNNIVEVEAMENQSHEVSGTTYDLLAILVNLNDYVVGADRGGEITSFDDFDIDFNQYKYLLETRISGALIKPHSAIAIEMAQAAAG